MKHHETTRYVKVTDGRGKRIDGLWCRNGVYYLQLRVPVDSGGTKPVRKRLEANNTQAAKKEAEKLRVQRDTGKAPAVKVPYVRDALNEWLDVYEAVRPKGSTRVRRQAAKVWFATIGNMKIDRVKPSKIRSVIAGRTAAGYSANTVRGEFDVINQLFNRAREDRTVHENPCEFVEQPKKKSKVRRNYTAAEVRTFADAQDNFPTYGARGRDLALLLAFSGLRVGEALQLKWDHIDFDSRELRVGVDFRTKSGNPRSVNFNPDLEAVLIEMKGRRLPDSPWMFPSYQGVGRRAQKPPSSWLKAAKATGLPIQPHDLRHFFCSQCVMSGIDFKTIAAWVGHEDPTLTVKTYSHLLDSHKSEMAEKVVFGVKIVEAA